MDYKRFNNSATDLVSIVVPVYNAEKYLPRCIESIINQSYKNLEVILVNDGSTDNSGRICDLYAKKDNRIKLIHTENNGPAKARNIGINNSNGEFIFFIDADDFIESNAIELLLDGYYQTKADLIIGDFLKIVDGNVFESEHNNFFSESKLLKKQDIIDYIRYYLKKPNRFPLFVYSWGRLFKASIIKNNNIFFPIDLKTFEDIVFNFDYLNYINEIFFIKKTIYNHLIHNNYASATMKLENNPEVLFGYPPALNKLNNYLKKYCSSDEITKKIGHAYICYTIIQLVRLCGQINKSNRKNIYRFIKEKINDPNLRNSLKFYLPSGDDSRILPILMRLKLIWPIIWVCKYKAYKRYKLKKK